MKNILVATFALLLFSCRKTPPPEPINPWQESFRYYTDKQIDTISYDTKIHHYIADSGKQNVFVYRNETGYDNEAFDDEYYLTVIFPVDPSVSSFSYTDEELKKHRCYYQASGAWSGYPDTLLDKGTIAGTKNDNGSWTVQIDIWLPIADDVIHTDHIISAGLYTKSVWQK